MTLRRNNEAVFTSNMLKLWKAIPTKVVGEAASACHLGVNYKGSSKIDIYRSFAKLNSYGSQKPPQIHQFIPLMNSLAQIHNKYNQIIKKEIEESILEHTKPHERNV